MNTKRYLVNKLLKFYLYMSINMTMFIQTKVKLKRINMLDDFFIRALIAGIGVALVTGPLGCFVVWRRLSYFGDTLSHSALLGVTLAYSFELNIALSVFIISSLIALILIQLPWENRNAFQIHAAPSNLQLGLAKANFRLRPSLRASRAIPRSAVSTVEKRGTRR